LLKSNACFVPYGTGQALLLKRFLRYQGSLNGRSKCNATIEMPIQPEALQAIESLNQTMLDRKKISVSQLQ